jgi:hypothetical protein
MKRVPPSTAGDVPPWVKLGWIVLIAGFLLALILLLFPELALLFRADFR